jgi:hypothetical protein
MPMKSPNIDRDIQILSTNGWADETYRQIHLNNVTPKELKLIVGWGYDRLSSVDLKSISKTNADVINLFYKYIDEGNHHGIRLIARATQKRFSLDKLPLLTAKSSDFSQGNNVQTPLLYALKNHPEMLVTLIPEASKQGIKKSALKPYHLAYNLHHDTINLYDILSTFIQNEIPYQKARRTMRLFGEGKCQMFEDLNKSFTKEAFWDAFSTINFDAFNPKSTTLLKDVVAKIFDSPKSDLFNDMHDTFYKARIGWGTPGTVTRLMDFIDSTQADAAAKMVVSV